MVVALATSIACSVTHGTATCWRHHGCRCSACHRALLEESKVARAVRALRRGRVAAIRVSPRRMLRHLDALTAAGLSANEVARRAGVAPSTLSRARHRGAQVSSIVSAAVLTVQS
jgi:acyl-CoA reductase-like NAD-dependent aldehyde dehydrogenase